jgi:hypothetical protein
MAIPMVTLGSVPWKTKFGTKLRPKFNIAEWIGRQEADSNDDPDWPF